MKTLTKKTKPIPKGHHTVTPYVVVSDIAKAIEFYKNAFGAVPQSHYDVASAGKITHAEIMIGDSMLMLGNESAQMRNFTPSSLKGVSVGFYLYVEDVDGFLEHARQNGALLERPAADMFWGDRLGQLKDPWGHSWTVATHKEDLSDEEVRRRAEAFYASAKK